jgi:hypothetical protein
VIAEMWALWQQKAGNAESEYEDACCYSEGFGPFCARAAVADGASTAFESQAWVNLLVRRFVDAPGPRLDAVAFDAWLGSVQREWASASAAAPAADSIFSLYDDDRAQEGTYGTFLGMELGGLDGNGTASWWRALSIGDTVLFHVRGDALVGQSPSMELRDFARGPALVHSNDDRRQADCAAIVVDAGGPLEAGDVVLVATDAFAAWLIRREESGSPVWNLIADIDPVSFSDLVTTLRTNRELVNDDVTVLVARLVNDPVPGIGAR